MVIFKAASTLKRDKKLAQVFTVNGIVTVKIIRGTKPYEIRELHQLDMLINQQTEQVDGQAKQNIGNPANIINAQQPVEAQASQHIDSQANINSTHSQTQSAGKDNNNEMEQ